MRDHSLFANVSFTRRWFLETVELDLRDDSAVKGLGSQSKGQGLMTWLECGLEVEYM